MATYAIVGTGGHGREAMAIAQQMPDIRDAPNDFVFVDVENVGSEVNGVPVLSFDQFVARDGDKYFNPAISSSSIRRKVVEEMAAADVRPFSIFANTFCNLGSNAIGSGAIFSPFTTVTVNATIGDYFHANNYSGVSHDCVIGDFVTFAPGVKCNGAVTIEDGAYIGAGAVIKQSTSDRRIEIGAGAVVGMGAVVTKNVQAGTTVYGNPATVRR